MSDFVSNGWSIFVAVVTIVGLIACLWLLVVASKRTVMANDNTTGHVFDGDLREMNNPLPRWWMVLFVLTVIFSVVYLLLYPGLGSSKGQLGWTSPGEVASANERARSQMEAVYARFQPMSVEALAQDGGARAIGERLFLNNCATCHGSDARGSKGFPNLTDDDWLWGGKPENIVETITKGRQGVMPPMAAALGSAEDARNVANYVLSLSGSPHNNIAAQLGKSKFGACAACHGIDGKGNQALGAPNLSDRIWLHGWGEAAVVAMIANGKHNQMPAFGERLTDVQVRILAGYVSGMRGQTLAAR